MLIDVDIILGAVLLLSAVVAPVIIIAKDRSMDNDGDV